MDNKHDENQDQPIQNYEARVNVTFGGQNADLPDPVNFNASDTDIRQWVTEAVRGGSLPGMRRNVGADLSEYVIDRFNANDQYPYNRIQIRPKTTFG